MANTSNTFFDDLEDGCNSIIGSIFDFLGSLIKEERPVEYSAEFGAISDQLRKESAGFRIGYKWGNTLKESHSHLICFGGSGSGKSVNICFPTLMQANASSYVVYDCSKEMYYGTASYLASIGYRIFVLDYDDFTKSIAVNVLAKCKSETDINRIAQVLVKNSQEGSQSDYWTQSAENIIAFFMYSLWKYADAKYINLPNVLNMLQVFSFDPGRIDRWMVKTGDERLINRYKSLVATPEKTLLSSLSTATNALAVYNDPNIAAITSQDSLSFDQLRREKCVLYLCSSPGMSTYARGVSASFFDSFFAHILSSLPASDDLPISFLLDEAATMRLTNSLPKILELGRKYSVSIATLWQDYGQVEHIFGKHEASNILANSRLKVYMPSGQPLATCRMLQDLLGKYQYETENGGTKIRELLTAQEIFQLKEILVLNGNNKPLLIEPAPYYENLKLRRRAEMPRYEIENDWNLGVPEMLPFE